MSYSKQDQAAQNAQDQSDEDKFMSGASVGGNPAMNRTIAAAYEKAHSAATGHSAGATSYENPGAADYGGGPDMAAWYGQQAHGHLADNDAQQASNSSALANSLKNMKGADARPGSVENQLLAQREAMTRGQEIGALNLDRQAAMGHAPSAARYQTQIGMNDLMGQRAGAVGGAHNAAALAGAQISTGTGLGSAAGNLAMTGGLARSKEIGDAIGAYGGLAGQVRGQDLTRLDTSNQNNKFNAGLNEDWKLGNAGLAAAQAGLGVAQGNTDMGWQAAAMAPKDKQFQYDQEMAAQQAGANSDAAGTAYAKDKDERANTQAIVGGMVQAGLTGIGSLAGPAGAAAGGMAGSAINSATKRYY